jgi:creatinine amidohydrolase
MAFDARNTANEIAKAGLQIAIFPIGAIEQHSLHLPLGTDWLDVIDLAQRIAAELDAFVVPALPFSMSQCHGAMAGTVWLRPETLAAVLRDVIHSLHAGGLRKVLVLNGHGGNFVLEAEIRRLNLGQPDLIVLMPPLFEWQMAERSLWDMGMDVHAEEMETSHQLYINPQHVKAGRVDYVPPVGREFLDYATMECISPSGVWGWPSSGTAEKGERLVAFSVHRVAQWARETFAQVARLRGT